MVSTINFDYSKLEFYSSLEQQNKFYPFADSISLEQWFRRRLIKDFNFNNLQFKQIKK